MAQINVTAFKSYVALNPGGNSSIVMSAYKAYVVVNTNSSVTTSGGGGSVTNYPYAAVLMPIRRKVT